KTHVSAFKLENPWSLAHQGISQGTVPANLTPCSISRVAIDSAQLARGHPAAVLSNELAQEVLREDTEGHLRLDVVKQARDQCGEGGRITASLDNILLQFESETSPLPIIGNMSLNKELEILASEPSTLLVKANDYSAKFLIKSFASN
ncbi:hypothetical protein BGZ94_004587, partial [Podila epigama]